MQCRALAFVLVHLSCLAACKSGGGDEGSAGSDSGGTGNTAGSGGAEMGSGGTSGGRCLITGFGSVDVRITGLPPGVEADLIVGGPAASQGVRTSQTLVGMQAGPYIVQAARVTEYDPIVRRLFDYELAETEFCLVGDETHTLEVRYQAIPTSHQLWTNNSNGTGALLGFAAPKLAATASTGPSVSVTAGAGKDVTFDLDGNLWSMGATVADPHLMRFPSASLAASGEKEADRRIDIADIPCLPALRAFAFDREGSLWVSTCGGLVSMLSAQDLLQSSLPVRPRVVLSNLQENGDVAFDINGNLWVTDGTALLRFDADRLTASGTVPDLILNLRDSGDTRYITPSNIAFDRSGGLWVIDFGANLVARVAVEDQARTGVQAVVSETTIALGVSALLERPAFDESGGLWLALSENEFGRLSPEQLTVSTTTGDPTLPATIVTSPNMGNANRIAFFPAAADLPIYHHFR